jgi:hypothetical protein
MKIIFILLSSFITYISSCQNISVLMTECKNYQRDIFFYNNCTDNSTVPTSMKNISCGDFTCPEGTYITYSSIDQSQICKKCPANTYSTGSRFRISGTLREWYPNKIKEFRNFCFVGNYENNDYNCTPFNINRFNSALQSGKPNKTNQWYTVVLSKNVKLENDGYV